MLHTTARRTIERILAGTGFGQQTIAMVSAASLTEDAGCPEPVCTALFEACLRLPPDGAAACTHPINQQPTPEDAAGLCRQLAPVVVAHPHDPALGASALHALMRLWPHCSGAERPLLRTRLINTLAGGIAGGAASLTVLELREWQRNVHTHHGAEPPSVANLRSILNAPDALNAYLALADHLGMAVELETLCWVLGSLAVQLLLGHHDPDCRLAALLHGLSACERLVPHAPADALVTLVSQINHRMWWLHRHGRMQAIRHSLDQTSRPYAFAVATGDITLAQRAARAEVVQGAARFWAETWRLVETHAVPVPAVLVRVLAVVDAARARNQDGAVSVDDAGVIAATLADIIYRHRRPG